MSVNLGQLGDMQKDIDYWLAMRELNLFLGRPEWEDISDIWRSYLQYDVRNNKRREHEKARDHLHRRQTEGNPGGPKGEYSAEDLKGLSVKSLRKLAKENNLSIPSGKPDDGILLLGKLKKADLIGLLLMDKSKLEAKEEAGQIVPPKCEYRKEGPEMGMSWWTAPLLFLALIIGILIGAI